LAELTNKADNDNDGKRSRDFRSRTLEAGADMTGQSSAKPINMIRTIHLVDELSAHI